MEVMPEEVHPFIKAGGKRGARKTLKEIMEGSTTSESSSEEENEEVALEPKPKKLIREGPTLYPALKAKKAKNIAPLDAKITVKEPAPKPSRVEVITEVRRDKGKKVEITAATMNLEDLKYEEIMVAIEENHKINKPTLTTEGPGGSSGVSEPATPPMVNPPPILMPQIDIDHVRKEYSNEEVIRLKLQPITNNVLVSFFILEQGNDTQKEVEAENSKKDSETNKGRILKVLKRKR